VQAVAVAKLANKAAGFLPMIGSIMHGFDEEASIINML